MHTRRHKPVAVSGLVRFGLASLTACGGAGSFPLELEVKDGAAIAGKRPDELELIVKTIPGVELKFDEQTRNVGDKAIETFTVQKSALKLGKNVFTVSATRGVFLSKEQAKAQVTWDAPAKAFVRFYPTGDDGGGGSVTCAGAMCGATTFKITKDGKIKLEGESALAGWLDVAGRRESVGNRQRKTFEVDVAAALSGVLLAQRDTLSVPIMLEIGSDKVSETLTLQGPGIVDALIGALGRAATQPVSFPKESAPPTEPRAVAVLGLPSNKLLIVGKATKVDDLDLVAIAKPAERFFSCGGGGSSASGILYLDLEISVFERRTGKAIVAKKLMADRVPCPTAEVSKSPLPGANASRQAKAEVRENDVSRALQEVLGGGSRAASPARK